MTRNIFLECPRCPSTRLLRCDRLVYVVVTCETDWSATLLVRPRRACHDAHCARLGKSEDASTPRHPAFGPRECGSSSTSSWCVARSSLPRLGLGSRQPLCAQSDPRRPHGGAQGSSARSWARGRILSSASSCDRSYAAACWARGSVHVVGRLVHGARWLPCWHAARWLPCWHAARCMLAALVPGARWLPCWHALGSWRDRISHVVTRSVGAPSLRLVAWPYRCLELGRSFDGGCFWWLDLCRPLLVLRAPWLRCWARGSIQVGHWRRVFHHIRMVRTVHEVPATAVLVPRSRGRACLGS